MDCPCYDLFFLSSMAFLKSFIGSFTALTSLVLLGGFSPALVGKDYTLEIDLMILKLHFTTL